MGFLSSISNVADAISSTADFASSVSPQPSSLVGASPLPLQPVTNYFSIIPPGGIGSVAPPPPVATVIPSPEPVPAAEPVPVVLGSSQVLESIPKPSPKNDVLNINLSGYVKPGGTVSKIAATQQPEVKKTAEIKQEESGIVLAIIGIAWMFWS